MARTLRGRMTPEETRLWQSLRGKGLGVSFRRQEPMGRYVADFVCHERGLVIELDGSQHLNSEADRARDADMAEHGFETLRFWNHEVRTNLTRVLERIQQTLEARKPL
ncbi:hypothetical protein DAERI_100026 [Deinococcus aerius]|uniref:DUF559 domain-containing protein n=1 Tax=Deinococcus aerius TaxID=200253 RepID=A0A2I9CX90_9DEIO|nr:hypothetical protein DAERI_100026 [Deinococcus aerius]